MNKLPYEVGKREVFVKLDGVETDSSYGCAPSERGVEELIDLGIVNVNKPSGPTSHQVSSYVKDILGLKKTGHTGTLDPKVTGVLPVALSRGTKVVQFLLKKGKEYVCLMKLHKETPESVIREEMRKWVGEIKQLPPVRSSIKRKLRRREIYYLEIMEIDRKEVLFKIGCEAGFYVRKFCHDFGEKLKVGAHMGSLIRTKVGGFNDKNWFSLQELKDAYEFWKDGDEKMIREVVKPVEFAVEHLPKIWIQDSAIDSLCHGADLNVPGIVKFEDFKFNEKVAVLSLKEELVCIGKVQMDFESLKKKEKGLLVVSEKVFMKTGVYPKL